MRRQRVHRGVGFLCAAVLSGCIPISTPAVIVEPTARGRSELAGVLAAALHTEKIVLADDALTIVPILLIDRSPARDEHGRALNGRDLSRPDTFRLFLIRGQCVLVHSQNGDRWELRQMRCRSTESATNGK